MLPKANMDQQYFVKNSYLIFTSIWAYVKVPEFETRVFFSITGTSIYNRAPTHRGCPGPTLNLIRRCADFFPIFTPLQDVI